MTEGKIKQRQGFRSLIGKITEEVSTATDRVPTDEISPDPKQPRKQFVESELNELAESIAELDILQPIVIRPAEADAPEGIKYYINYGEKRWRCAKRLKMETVPVTIKKNAEEGANDGKSVVKLFLSQIAENTVRTGLLDGDFILAMCNIKTLDSSISQTVISKSIGVPSSTISNAITIGNSKYSEELIQLVDKGAAFRAIADLARLIKKDHKIWDQVSDLEHSMFTIEFVEQLRQTNELSKKSTQSNKDDPESGSDNPESGSDNPESGSDNPESGSDDSGSALADGDSDDIYSALVGGESSADSTQAGGEEYQETIRNGVTNLDFVGGDDANNVEGGFSKRPVSKAAVNVMVSYREGGRRFMGRLALDYKASSPELIPVLNEKDVVQMVSMVDVEITLIGYE